MCKVYSLPYRITPKIDNHGKAYPDRQLKGAHICNSFNTTRFLVLGDIGGIAIIFSIDLTDGAIHLTTGYLIKLLWTRVFPNNFFSSQLRLLVYITLR